MSTARDVLDEVASAIEPDLEIADPARARRDRRDRLAPRIRDE